jgi:hypothetical protein
MSEPDPNEPDPNEPDPNAPDQSRFDVAGFDPAPHDELGGWSMARVAALAEQAHSGQVDKAGRPYVEHPARVARLLADRSESVLRQALGLLHDTVEDTTLTLDQLARVGLPPRVVAGVEALTHRPGEPAEAYYARVRVNADALAVKFADLDDNSDPARLGRLDIDTRQRLEAKYAHARMTLRDHTRRA